MVFADEWSRGRNYSTVPVAVKAALLAFKETLSFVYPSETYGSVPLPSFSVEVVDTMCDSSLEVSADCTAMTDDDVTTLITGAMQGGRVGCSHMPTPSLVIGGTNRPSVIDEVIATAASEALPALGFRSWKGDANATNETWFSRVNPSSTQGVTLTVDFLQEFSVTGFMLWYCDDAEGAQVAAAVQDAASALGMRVTLAELEQGGDSSSWSSFATMAQDEAIYDHVVAVDKACDVTGLMTYLGSDAGMQTSEYTWVGLYSTDVLLEAYEADYGTTTFPMDAFIVVQEPLETNRSAEMDSWWDSAVSSGDDIEDWVVDFMGSDTSFGTKSSEVLELWRTERNATSAANGGVRDDYLFDAVYAAQLAVWKALYNGYGSATTGWLLTASAAELQQMLLGLDFESLTGRVRFESSGERLLSYDIAQYQR